LRKRINRNAVKEYDEDERIDRDGKLSGTAVAPIIVTRRRTDSTILYTTIIF